MAKIFVLGGDGFCGWPTSLHLSKLGHEVVIVDNLSRRKIDVELEVESLTPIRPLSVRVAAWQEQNSGSDVFEDRELEVTSVLDISVEGQVQALARALLERGEPASKYGQG